MLQFNPFFRPSVDKILESPYFDEVRQFSIMYDAVHEVDLLFEHSKQYFGLKDIRKKMLEELEHYRALKN